MRRAGADDRPTGDEMSTGAGHTARPSANEAAAGAGELRAVTIAMETPRPELLDRVAPSAAGALDRSRRSSLPGGLPMSGEGGLCERCSDILNGGSEGSESIQKDQRCATIQDWKDWKTTLLFYGRKD